MTHKQRILADRILAVPVAFLFNGLARVLGKLLRRDHSVTSENVKVIVVAKLLGMGSILQSVPLLRALKRRYPNAKLIFVTMKSNRELLSRLPVVDEILVLDDRSAPVMAATTLRAIATLIARKADLYFDLEVYSGFASLLALCAVTRNRLGFYRHSTKFKKGIYTHLVYFNTHMPVRQLYLQLGRTTGIPKGESELTGPILVHDHERQAVARLLAKTPGWRSEAPYIVVNPNASDLLLERRWPLEHAVEAISRLVSSGEQIALIGSRDEVDFVRSLCDRLPAEVRSRIADTAGRLTLGELLALIAGAACVLTNDTGPMHMSIALQRPTACLFGPVNPAHYGHDLPFVDIFYEQVFCSPCLHEVDAPPCNGNNVCMQRIEPEAVVEAVRYLAHTGFPRRKRQREAFLDIQPVLADTSSGSPLGVVMRASTKLIGEAEELRCIACSAPMVPRFPDSVAHHWRCPHCGLENIWPQPDDGALSAIYNDRYFSHYKSTIDPQLTRSMKRATFDRQLRLLASAGPFPNHRRLLDCGAATGILAELAKEQGWDAFAIEFSEFGADACAQLLGPDHVYRGEVQSAYFAANPENRFEVITMCDFIEHVRDPREVLRWARERLAPGGVLLLTTPEVGSLSWRLMGRHWFHYVPEHLWFLNAQSIRTLLSESGFEDVAIAPLGKTVTVDYALAYYDRSTTASRIFSPVAPLLRSLLPAFIRRQSLRFYLGEMVVTGRASVKETSRGAERDALKCIACSTPMAPAFSGAVASHWQCPHCGLESIWPQPDDQRLSAIYNDQYFSYYKSTIDPQLTRSMKRATFDRQLRLLASAGPFPNHRRLLDCGAATGILAELAKEQGWDAFAIEFSEFGADACAQLLGPDHVYRGEVQSAYFAANPENRFEVITMCDLIEHVRDPREVLNWARERLMPGGVLLLTTPEVGSLSWRLMGRHWFHYVPEHLWFLNAQSIRTLLSESGFEDVAVSPVRKTVTVEYALACYDRSTTASRIARLLQSLLPAFVRRQSFRLYLGQMVVTARASVEEASRGADYPANRADQLTGEYVSGKAV